MDLQAQLQQLHKKVMLLIKQLQQLQKENGQLKKEVEKLQANLQGKTDQLNLVQQKLDAVKVGKQAYSNEEKQILEKRIDTYLKEIDKCLALLNA